MLGVSAAQAMRVQDALRAPETQHWGVDVRRNGETLVTIESNFLSGKSEFSEVEAEVIRQCADHLHAFIGPPSTQEPQTVCEWRFVPEAEWWESGCDSQDLSGDERQDGPPKEWKGCPYCTSPLTLSPESPNEGAK